MKNRIAAIATTAAMTAALALPAFAGGPVEAPMEAPVAPAPMAYAAPSADWTGGYVGAQLGYGKASGSTAFDGNGAVGGFHAGYLYDMGQFVTGVELSHDFSNVDVNSGAGKVKGVTDLKLLAGADLGKTFVYATAGASRARLSDGVTTASDNGYVYGIGASYSLNDKWNVGGEILGHKYNDFNASGSDLDMTTVSAKVSYKF
jgi:outer membrane immunogenic protein